jgi:hypothetical protein
MRAYHKNSDNMPGNCTTGAMLLTALALSDDNLLSALRASQVVHRVELSLHSCKVFAKQDDAWIPASRAVHNLREVLTTVLPAGSSTNEPYSDERVLQIWREHGARVSVLRAVLK